MEIPDVVYLVTDNQEPFQTESPSESLVFSAGISGGHEDFLVNHTGSADFQPTRSLTDRATLLSANGTSYIEFEPRLHERKKARPYPHVYFFLEKTREKLLG